MQENILRNSNLAAIYLVYKDTEKHKFSVNLRFMDTKECYLTTAMQMDFVKPKKNTLVEIFVYSSDGVYKSEVKIADVLTSLNEIVFIVNLPKKWDYTQVRNSSRKQYSLPFKIKYNDGYEISGNTYDISVGGISFMLENPIPSLYTKVNGSIEFTLPSNSAYVVEQTEILTDVKFLRTITPDYTADKYYVYKFLNLPKDKAEKIKNFLIYLD